MKVYAPMWFHIKKHNKCTDGPKNLFRTIQSSRYMSPELLDVIDPVIQRNGFFGHPSNILLTMLIDERKYIRELAYRRINKYRLIKINGLNDFQLLKFNMNATDYYDLIDWTSTSIHEPAITRGLPESVLFEISKTGFLPPQYKNMLSFPCHSQAVERHVKLVTEAASNVAGVERQTGYIRSKINSRNKMSQFDSKKDFVL